MRGFGLLHSTVCCIFPLVFQIALRVHLRLDRSLHLCGDNETDTDCCPKPLCVLETLQLSACVNDTPQASVLIQARVHARLHPVSGSGRSCSCSCLQVVVCHPETSDSCLSPPSISIFLPLAEGNTTVPNQFYQTLGQCPCDLTFSSCDVRCCCDKVFHLLKCVSAIKHTVAS